MAYLSLRTVRYGCGLLVAGMCLAACGDDTSGEQETTCEVDVSPATDALTAAGEAVEARRVELDTACRAIANGLDPDNAPPDDGTVDIKVSCGAAKTAIEAIAMDTSIDQTPYECVADAAAQSTCEAECTEALGDCASICAPAGSATATCDTSSPVVVTSDDDAVKATLEAELPTVLRVTEHVTVIADALSALLAAPTFQEEGACSEEYTAVIAQAADIVEAIEEVVTESLPVIGATSG